MFQLRSSSSADCNYRFSSTIKFLELVFSPVNLFWTMVSQLAYCTYWVISLLNMSLISAMYIVMERILKGKCEKLVSSFILECDSADYCFVSSPTAWHTSSSVEKSWSHLTDFEVFLKSSFFHMPTNNLYDLIRLISDFDLVKTITIPVVSLRHIPTIKVVLDIIMMSKVIGWIDK